MKLAKLRIRKSKAKTLEAKTEPDVPDFTEMELLMQNMLARTQATHQGIDNMARDLEVVEGRLRNEAEIVMNEAAFRTASLVATANQISVMRSHLRRPEQMQVPNVVKALKDNSEAATTQEAAE